MIPSNSSKDETDFVQIVFKSYDILYQEVA